MSAPGAQFDRSLPLVDVRRMSPDQEQSVRAFMTGLRFAGGNATRVCSGFEMAEAIEKIARQNAGARSVLYEPFDLAEDLGLPLALSARGVRLVPVSQAGGQIADFKIALTEAQMAIAESGSLLIGGENSGWGLATVLPWVHIAVLRAQDIAADLASAFALFQDRFERGERNWVWVTGPSKTADIAKTLVMGIHGPNALEVLIVVDDESSPGRST